MGGGMSRGRAIGTRARRGAGSAAGASPWPRGCARTCGASRSHRAPPLPSPWLCARALLHSRRCLHIGSLFLSSLRLSWSLKFGTILVSQVCAYPGFWRARRARPPSACSPCRAPDGDERLEGGEHLDGLVGDDEALRLPGGFAVGGSKDGVQRHAQAAPNARAGGRTAKAADAEREGERAEERD